jgi:class 3 adenylate cyclase
LVATWLNPTSRAVGRQKAIRVHDRVRGLGLDVRAGVHTGECEFAGEDVAGIAVHIGSRVAALARGGEVLVSNTVKDLVTGSAIKFTDRGTHELKGVPDPWRVWEAAAVS